MSYFQSLQHESLRLWLFSWLNVKICLAVVWILVPIWLTVDIWLLTFWWHYKVCAISFWDRFSHITSNPIYTAAYIGLSIIFRVLFQGWYLHPLEVIDTFAKLLAYIENIFSMVITGWQSFELVVYLWTISIEKIGYESNLLSHLLISHLWSVGAVKRYIFPTLDWNLFQGLIMGQGLRKFGELNIYPSNTILGRWFRHRRGTWKNTPGLKAKNKYCSEFLVLNIAIPCIFNRMFVLELKSLKV